MSSADGQGQARQHWQYRAIFLTIQCSSVCGTPNSQNPLTNHSVLGVSKDHLKNWPRKRLSKHMVQHHVDANQRKIGLMHSSYLH